jgi:putative hemolysin
MMIPRGEIVWLDADRHRRRRPARRRRVGAFALPGLPRRARRRPRRRQRAAAPQQAIQGRTIAVNEDLLPPVFVPETLSGMELLEQFRASSSQIVFVVDEYGEVQG